MRMAFEVRVDCPTCLVEGARTETWDAESRSFSFNLPESVRCRLCGHTAEVEHDSNTAQAFLVDRVVGRSFGTLADLEVALGSWAAEEGLSSSVDLLDAYFVLRTPTEIFDALSRRERIETTFDVADYLFSSGVAGGGGGAAVAMISKDDEHPVLSRSSMPMSIRPVAGPREELLAIASVAAADGEASPDDLVVLQRAAEKRGVMPLSPDEIRVWRPNEIPPPSTLVDRERVLEEMFQTGWSDGQMDESELRVIRDFARAWGIDPERLREWTELYSLGDSNAVERWFRRIGLFLFPAR